MTTSKSKVMTQKEALNRLEEYCKVSNKHLIQGSLYYRTYAISVPTQEYCGGIIDYDGNYYKRLSGYMKPTELLIWLDGYFAGLHKNK